MKNLHLVLLIAVLACGSVRGEEFKPKRGNWVAFVGEEEILSANGDVLRKAAPGEVVRVRITRDGWAEIASSIPDLVGGKVKFSGLRPATPEENEAWIAANKSHAVAAAEEAAPIEFVAPPEMEAKLAAAEPPFRPPTGRSALPKDSGVREPVMGWFAPGAETQIHSMERLADGSIVMSGSLKPPITFPGARGWAGPVPGSIEEGESFAFLARIAPDLQSLPDLLVFAPGEVRSLKRIRPSARGGFWILAGGTGPGFAGELAAKSRDALLRISADFTSVLDSIPLAAAPRDFVLDGNDRPVLLLAAGGRKGGGGLFQTFAGSHFHKPWAEAPDGPAHRLVLDFSSPALANGPFALWAKKSEITPDFPTPLGPWGSEPNAGQPIQWTNVASGKNPIRGANLMPEALVLDREGNVIVAGTIPFHMGFPDFDPFLIKFSPQGKFLWNNCFLAGLLSEPDQKTQSMTVDPSNGDILISYWQHGNNSRTLLLAPDGWLRQFTGTNGNIKISWIGRVDAATGQLKNATLLHSRLPESRNPKWPDLNSVSLAKIAADDRGRVFATGGTTLNLPVTSNAFLPSVTEYGGHPFFAVIKPDLSGPVYCTYLSPAKGNVRHMVLAAENLAVLAGELETAEPTLTSTGIQNSAFLTGSPPEGKSATFLAIVPVPDEDVGWSFD